jgi:steroid delta-isomerase-like uncharacterized protein
MDSSTSPVEVASALFEALNQRDLDQAAKLWHADLVEDFVAIGEFRGPESARGFFEELFAAVPDIVFTVDRLIGDEEHAVVQWHITGTFSGGSFQGIHATGRTVELRGVDVMHIVEGQLKHNTIYYDGLAFARQIGLLPTQGTLADKALMSGFNAKTDVFKRVAAAVPKGRSATA